MYDELIEGYFSSNESFIHLNAKEKLFELIKSKRVKIKDQFGEEYKIFDNRNDDEFLHIESFVMNYSNEVIFSNRNSPCKGHTDIKPLCGQEGYFGAFKDLPCGKCVFNSIGDIKYSSKYASFRPDLAFGHSGIHKVWFEIKHKHESSFNKMKFCHENNIVLLEINANLIDEFEEYNGELIFEKLTYEPFSFESSAFQGLIAENILNKGFIFVSDLKRAINLTYRESNGMFATFDIYFQLKEEFELTEVFDTHKGISKHFGYTGAKKILIPTRDLYKINQIKEEYNIEIENEIENVFRKLTSEVYKKGFMLQKSFKDKAQSMAPAGHRSGIDFTSKYEQYNLSVVNVDKHLHELIKLGIDPKDMRKTTVIPKELFNK